MPNSQPVYEAINGLEAKEILKKNVCDKIDKIPLLNGGNAFHQLRMIYSIVFSAFPADCPVPDDQELELVLKAPDFNENEAYIKQAGAIKKLEEKKNKFYEDVDKIDKILETLNPQQEETVELDAGDIPDNLRVEHDLKLPRIEKRTSIDGSTHRIGTMRKASDL